MKSINKEIQYYQGYKYKIYPTESQKALIDRCIELNRFVYNWALEKENEQLKLYREEKLIKVFYQSMILEEYSINFIILKKIIGYGKLLLIVYVMYLKMLSMRTMHILEKLKIIQHLKLKKIQFILICPSNLDAILIMINSE